MQQEQEEALQQQTEAFQTILRRERALRGWSQADVAERVGSDPKTVGRWERGLTFTSPYMCQQLSQLYGKTVQQLGLVRAENAAITGDKAKETSANSSIGGNGKNSQQGTGEGEYGVEQESGLIGSTSTKMRQIQAGNIWHPLVNWRSCWRSFLFVSLLLISMLLITTGAWALLHRGSTQIGTIATPTSSNPYAGQGTLALNEALTTNTASSWSLSNNDEGQCFFADVNHTLLYRGTDGAYPDGQIGLLAHTCSIVYLDSQPDICATPVEVAFSDAKVWKM